MKFGVRFLNSEKYPIDGFIDALLDEPMYNIYHISVSFLDFHNNSAIILASGEFGEFMKEKFQHNKHLIFTLPDNYHNPFHIMTLAKDGYLECGCGYRESEQEHIKRIMIISQSKPSQMLEIKIISRSEVPV